MFEFLSRKRWVPFLMKLSDDVFHAPRWHRLERTLRAYSQGRDDYFFVQIGANDGITHDRLYPFVTEGGWRGILIEPVPYYFQKLKENYRGNPRLIFENAAISATEGEQDLFRIREGIAHLPGWVNGLASLHLDVLLNHKWAIPDIEDYIVKERVRCVPLERLLREHRVAKIDLLAIDTEGHDYEIIKRLDLNRLKPPILTYEHKHLSRGDRKACVQLLRGFGYTVTSQLGNTLAYLPRPDAG